MSAPSLASAMCQCGHVNTDHNVGGMCNWVPCHCVSFCSRGDSYCECGHRYEDHFDDFGSECMFLGCACASFRHYE